jgi:transposase
MENNTEIWKVIDGTYYLISSHGNVKSTCYGDERAIKLGLNGGGYLYFTLFRNGIGLPRMVHRIVAQVFVENLENKPEVNHINGNKLDNVYTNLEWVTRLENVQHACRTGLVKLGDDRNDTKLKEVDVIAIKQLFVEYKLSNEEIGTMYGVSRSTISQIRNLNNWKHIAPELVFKSSSPCAKGAKKKLFGEDIPIIRKMYRDGLSCIQIGRKYNVHESTIGSIISGKNWKNY